MRSGCGIWTQVPGFSPWLNSPVLVGPGTVANFSVIISSPGKLGYKDLTVLWGGSNDTMTKALGTNSDPGEASQQQLLLLVLVLMEDWIQCPATCTWRGEARDPKRLTTPEGGGHHPAKS